MGISAGDVVPFTQARSNLSELADLAKAGAQIAITKNGESCVLLIDAARLDDCHRLEREHIHLLLFAGFLARQQTIEAFLVDAQADPAFDRLLTAVPAIVIPNLQRFLRMGRCYRANPPQ